LTIPIIPRRLAMGARSWLPCAAELKAGGHGRSCRQGQRELIAIAALVAAVLGWLAGADTALPVRVRLEKRLRPRGVHSCGGWVPSTVPDEWSPRVCRPSVRCCDCSLRRPGSALPPCSAEWPDHGGGGCQQAPSSAPRRGGGRRLVAASGTSGALREDGEKPRGCGGGGWRSASP